MILAKITTLVLCLFSAMFVVSQIQAFRTRKCKCVGKGRQLGDHVYCSMCGKFRGVIEEN